MLVGIRHPRHLALPGTHIGCRYVGGRAKETLTRQLQGEASRDLLHLIAIELERIDQQRPFGATEGNIHQGTFVAHQCRQRFHLILVGVRRVANTPPWQEADGWSERHANR